MKGERYAGWEGQLGQAIVSGTATLTDLADRVAAGELDPTPRSGRQERFENVVNNALWKPDDRPKR
jgi:xylose isomerase